MTFSSSDHQGAHNMALSNSETLWPWDNPTSPHLRRSCDTGDDVIGQANKYSATLTWPCLAPFEPHCKNGLAAGVE